MQIKRVFKKKKWIDIFLSISFSYLFVFAIPWDNFKEFNDIKNYLSRIIYLSEGGTEYEYKGISIFSSEIIWKNILVYLSSLKLFDGNYRAILQLISFISLFIYTHFSLKRISFVLFFFLVFNPLFMHLIIEQIRIALAFSFLLVVYEYRDIKWIYILLPVAIFTHTAAILIIGIYFLLNVIRKRINKKNIYKNTIIISFLFAIFLKYGIDFVLGILGDRRINYTADSSSILFSLFWFFCSIILILFCKKNNDDLIRIVSFSIFMIGLFFSSSLIGSYGQRYIALSIPLIIISINGIRNYRVKNFIFFVFVLYNVISWFYWFKIFNIL